MWQPVFKVATSSLKPSVFLCDYFTYDVTTNNINIILSVYRNCTRFVMAFYWQSAINVHKIDRGSQHYRISATIRSRLVLYYYPIELSSDANENSRVRLQNVI